MSTTKHGLILVVDDDEAIRTLARDVLSEAGYRVTTARSFGEAVDALGHTRFALVLTDMVGAVTADRTTQEAVLTHIRTRAGYTPLVLFTTARESTVVATATERGFQAVLFKPFDIDELVATVQRHLASPL